MRRSRPRHGVALVLVLWIVVILGAVAAGLAADTRGATSVATNARAQLIARYAAESGIELTVARIEAALAVATDTTTRQAFLNGLEREQPAADTVALDRGRFTLAIVDASARLDVNTATEEQLARFFSRFTDLGSAASAARDIRGWIERRDGSPLDASVILDSTGAARTVRPLTTLDELRSLRLVNQSVVERAAAYLTVDGDGTINRAAAPAIVREVAGGELRDEPSRLVLVSRGWEQGHPSTHEIQAVYAVTGDRLVLIRWRERAR